MRKKHAKSENELPPERRRLNAARRTARSLRGQPVFPKRGLKDKLPSPANPKEAREWLKELADFLSTYPNASRQFRFIAYAIKRFLRNGDEGNLRKELGLVNPVGNPSSFQVRMRTRERARTIIELKDKGTPWHLIGEKVGLSDKRSLKKLYAEYTAIFRKEKLLAGIAKELKTGLDEPGEDTTLHSPSS